MPTHFSTVSVEAGPQQALRQSQERLPPLALIVDDEPVITETLAAILNGSGLAAMTASNGHAALETAMLIPPEILITDLAMPGMNGLDLALEIKRRTPDCEVIVFSGHVTAADLAWQTSHARAGFVTLVKPVHPVDLLSCVFEALGRKGCTLAPKSPVRSSGLYDFLASARCADGRLSPAANLTVRQRLRSSDMYA